MKDIKLSEKAKDRILNLALIGSLLLLAGTFLRQPDLGRESPPPQTNYSLNRVNPIVPKTLPTFEEVSPIVNNPSSPTASAPKTAAPASRPAASSPSSPQNPLLPNVSSGFTEPRVKRFLDLRLLNLL